MSLRISGVHPTICRESESRGPQYEGNIIKKSLPNDWDCHDMWRDTNIRQFVIFCSMVLYCKPKSVYHLIGGMHWHIHTRIVVYSIPSLTERVPFLKDTKGNIWINLDGFPPNIQIGTCRIEVTYSRAVMLFFFYCETCHESKFTDFTHRAILTLKLCMFYNSCSITL